MSNQVLIAGDGALARVLTDILTIENQWIVCGYIGLKEETLLNKPVYIKETTPSNLSIISGILNPIYREEHINYFGIERFPTIREGFISSNSTLGPGTVSMKNSYVMNNTTIAKGVHIHTTALVGHNCIIDDYSIIGAGCIVCGWSETGKKVRLGVGAKILPHVKIGDEATIAAGAVVTEDVPAGITVGGVPAVPISKTDFNKFQRNK